MSMIHEILTTLKRLELSVLIDTVVKRHAMELHEIVHSALAAADLQSYADRQQLCMRLSDIARKDWESKCSYYVDPKDKRINDLEHSLRDMLGAYMGNRNMSATDCAAAAQHASSLLGER